MNGRTSAIIITLVSLVLAGVAVPSVTLAQTTGANADVPPINLQRWRPAPNPGDFLTVYGSTLEEHLRVTGGFYINYAENPYATESGIGSEKEVILDFQFFADVFVSMSLFDWVEVGIALPVAMLQGTQTGGAPYNQNLESSGLGDLRVAVKGKILDIADFPIGASLVAVLNLPTATDDLFYSDDGVGFDALAVLEYVPWGRIRLALNAGYRFRPKTADLIKFTIGDAVLLSGAVAFPLFRDDLDLLIELHGEIGVEATDDNDSELASEERPLEGELGVRWRLVNDDSFLNGLSTTGAIGFGTTGPGSPVFRAILGLSYHWVTGGQWSQRYSYGGYLAEIDECPDPETTPESEIPEICREVEVVDSDGDGVPDSQDRCPFKGKPGEVDENGCSNTDRDGDGIPDSEDQCPEVPEDPDGYKDVDGCPDLDNDGDGIADLSDKCPLEAEILNGIDDTDGCPDNDPDSQVFFEDGKFKIKEQVFFETAKAKIKRESFPLLDQVADVLTKNPHVGGIDIEGHTDSRGDDDYNKQLSQDRAQSVLDYLVKQGVKEERLRAIGYGEEEPIADNGTREGRAKNRRVEFTVRDLKQK